MYMGMFTMEQILIAFVHRLVGKPHGHTATYTWRHVHMCVCVCTTHHACTLTGALGGLLSAPGECPGPDFSSLACGPWLPWAPRP